MEWEGITFAVERGVGEDLRFATFHMWDSSQSAKVPLDVAYSVCANLGFTPDIFDLKH